MQALRKSFLGERKQTALHGLHELLAIVALPSDHSIRNPCQIDDVGNLLA